MHLQVDVGIAAKIKEEIDAKVRQMMKMHPADYDLGAVDVRMAGLAQKELKAKFLICVKYNCRREPPSLFVCRFQVLWRRKVKQHLLVCPLNPSVAVFLYMRIVNI